MATYNKFQAGKEIYFKQIGIDMSQYHRGETRIIDNLLYEHYLTSVNKGNPWTSINVQELKDEIQYELNEMSRMVMNPSKYYKSIEFVDSSNSNDIIIPNIVNKIINYYKN